MSEGIERPSDQTHDVLTETTPCPRCGSAYKASSVFCGDCGWRLDITPSPNPGRLGAKVVMLVATLAFAIGLAIYGPGAGPTEGDPAGTASSVTSSTESANRRAVALPAASVASPSQSIGGDLDRLADGDPLTLWFHEIGDGPIPPMVLVFAQSATFTEVVFHNAEEGPAFARHSRIREVELSFGGSTQLLAAELPDTPGRHRVRIPGIATEQVTIRVVSVYPGQEMGGEAPFDELAIAEVTFQGFEDSSS